MPLQRQFVGLSDHIGKYDGGNVSQELSGALVQVFDGEDFINPFDYLRVSAALTAQGQAIVQTVPAGELWRVRSIHAEWLNAGGVTQFQPIVNPDGIGLVGLDKPRATTETVGTGITGYDGFQFSPSPMVLSGSRNAQIGFQQQFFVFGTTNVDLVVCRQRILI